MAASVGLDGKLERDAKRGGDTFHLLPHTVAGVYALHVCGLVSTTVLCLSQTTLLLSEYPLMISSSALSLSTTMSSNPKEKSNSCFSNVKNLAVLL